MTLKEVKQQLRKSLSVYYDLREANSITDIVLESITGLSRVDRLLHENAPLSIEQIVKLKDYQEKLLNRTPVQYVLGKAHFAGMDLYVDSHVLIPRPETEELVEWVVQSEKERPPDGTMQEVLDIGSGSGCIALALMQKLSFLRVTGADISLDALEVARKNASKLGLKADFVHLDVLDEAGWAAVSNQDIIVSNPPYIHLKEKSEMVSHVLDFEPHQALFVNDPDVLIFYRKIADLAVKKLRDGGMLFFEINPFYVGQLVEMLKIKQFASVEIKRDLQGKERMVKCLFKK